MTSWSNRNSILYLPVHQVNVLLIHSFELWKIRLADDHSWLNQLLCGRSAIFWDFWVWGKVRAKLLTAILAAIWYLDTCMRCSKEPLQHNPDVMKYISYHLFQNMELGHGATMRCSRYKHMWKEGREEEICDLLPQKRSTRLSQPSEDRYYGFHHVPEVILLFKLKILDYLCSQST